ncbi:hypothetical protein MSAN_02256700 [Mycena sanguinolenta]|uniref:Uncharacterized protein n=1 Tax=Mycena sanguinolenta TaxID=230812 RepID=A0A8H7CH85_9AGAR|nr:hypothetical protein MSAN_02256700 [Mycena sanguinolenta]
MAIEPKKAIQQLLDAFKESQGRIQSLERILVLERQAAQDALSGAAQNHAQSLQETLARERDAARDALSRVKTGYLEISFKHEAEISALRKEIAVLREDSAKLQTDKDDEEETIHLRAKYEGLKTTHRELKRAFSELDAKQADLVSNAAACQELALEATRAKGVADEALRDLQNKHNALKAKKARKSAKDCSEQVAALTADSLSWFPSITNTGVSSKAKSSQESYSKLDRVYKEELELSAEVLKRYDKLSATNKDITQKYLALVESTTQMKKTCDELEAQNLKLHQDHQALSARRLKTCTEVVAEAEKMKRETAQLRATINTLYDEARVQENRLESVLNVNQAFRSRVQNGRVSIEVARVLYDDFMHTFPTFVLSRPNFLSLQPVAKIGINLAEYLAADQVCAGAVNSALYLPLRTVWCSTEHIHLLAFIPTHQYDKRGTWTQTEDIPKLVGSWREVFIDLNGSIFYVGTYKCHDLRFLCPGGTPPPDVVSPLEMVRAARLEVLPLEERSSAINYFFPSGIIDADCMGMQCVGFNTILYDALLRRSSGVKREREDFSPAQWQRDPKRTRLDAVFPPINTL